jgi:hypothetical protein
MGNLHQHLAALNELEAQDRKILEETGATWKKQELFDGFIRVLHMEAEDRQHEEKGATESRTLTTTAIERLKYMFPFMVENLDAQLQREVANALATADVTLPNGEVLKGMPVTAIMHREKYWTRVRQVMDGIPTIDTTKRWVKDEQAALEGVLRTAETEKANRTEKQMVVITKAEATDKHPAQVELHPKDVVVGYYEKTSQTGKMTPAAKAALLAYIDGMILAYRKAKAVANETAVDPSVKAGEVELKGLIEAVRAASK